MSKKRPSAPAGRIAYYQGPRVSANPEVRALLRTWGYDARDVSPRQVASGALEEFDALYMPGGHSVRIREAPLRALKRFVRRGGGFVGICNGAHFAARVGLLDVRNVLIVRAYGTYAMRVVARHPVTRGLRRVPRSPERKGLDPVPHTNVGRVRMDRGNGAFLELGPRATALLTYDNDDRYAGVAAGEYGRGRVVVFSGHPQADWDHKDRRLRKYNPDLEACRRLLANAFAWAAGAQARG